jgi:glycosyltransferase involved in cell wall biosynthesis
MINKVKISIITPSFNSGKYIRRAINSVLSQDYDNWEHIVIDGGSTDGTLEILKKYSHLKFVSEQDKGQSDAMNKGFHMSNGDIIGYLNADDYYHQDIFSPVIKEFTSGTSEMVVGKIKIQKETETEIRTPSTKFEDIIDFRKNLFPANPVSYFYRRNVQIEYGNFPIENHMTMDMDFLFFTYKYFNVTYLPLIFGTFVLDGDNKTANMNIGMEQQKVYEEFMRKHEKGKYVEYLLRRNWKKTLSRMKILHKEWLKKG